MKGKVKSLFFFPGIDKAEWSIILETKEGRKEIIVPDGDFRPLLSDYDPGVNLGDPAGLLGKMIEYEYEKLPRKGIRVKRL